MNNPPGSIPRSLRFARFSAAILIVLCIGLYGLGILYWPGYITQHPEPALPYNWKPAVLTGVLALPENPERKG